MIRFADRPRGGFTLVEVMVALAIVSIVVFSLLLSANAASRDAYVASRYRLARLLADEKMGEVMLGIAGREAGSDDGDFKRDDEEGGYPDVYWRLDVLEEEWQVEAVPADGYVDPVDAESEAVPPDPIMLRRVQLTVWFEGFEGDPEGEIIMETMMPMFGETPGLAQPTDEGGEPR